MRVGDGVARGLGRGLGFEAVDAVDASESLELSLAGGFCVLMLEGGEVADLWVVCCGDCDWAWEGPLFSLPRRWVGVVWVLGWVVVVAFSGVLAFDVLRVVRSWPSFLGVEGLEAVAAVDEECVRCL